MEPLTSDHDALLQQVIATPDDDAPRLIYADWLDEHGDADRAEFIRVQINLARAAADDPQREEWQAREQALLEQYAYQWALPLGNRVHAWAFRRGFIECVQTHLQNAARKVRELFRLAPIRQLRDGNFHYTSGGDNTYELDALLEVLPELPPLTGLELTNIYRFVDTQVQQLLTSPYVANLQTLMLTFDNEAHTGFKDEVLVAAYQSPYLANLRILRIGCEERAWSLLRYGPLVRDALCTAPYLSELRYLSVHQATLFEEHITPLLRALPNVQHLVFHGVLFNHGALGKLAVSVPQTRICKLEFYGCDQEPAPQSELVILDDLVVRHQFASSGVTTSVDYDSFNSHSFLSWSGWRWLKLQKQNLIALGEQIENESEAGLEAWAYKNCVVYAGQTTADQVAALSLNHHSDAFVRAFTNIREQAETQGRWHILLHLVTETPWRLNFILEHDAPVAPYGARTVAEFITIPESAPFVPPLWERPPFNADAVLHYLIAGVLLFVARHVRHSGVTVPVEFVCGTLRCRIPTAK